MRFLILFLFLPLIGLGQTSVVRIASNLECDTVFSNYGKWLVYTISENYVAYQPENVDEDIMYARSAVLLFAVGQEKPLLVETTLLTDTTEAQILHRLKTRPKIEKPPHRNDTIELGEESETVLMTFLGDDIFEISHSNWQYYPGAAHGAGAWSVQYFVANSASYFGFHDVFSDSIFPFIQQKLKENIRTEFPNWMFNEAEVDSIAAENYGIASNNYLISRDGLTIGCQMYCSLFGWVQMGYSEYGITIGWDELKPYLLANNPLQNWLD